MSTGFPDWTRAYLLIGSHEGELIPVYVDADGKLFAALQGEYEGQLRTIALDDQGRISAFIIDSTDAWGQMLAVGNAELAARLGSPVRHDRRGQLIYANSFDNGLGNIQSSVYGTGAEVALAPDNTEIGGYSLRLTAGSSSGGMARVWCLLPHLPVSSTGVALRFQTPQNYTYWDVGVFHYNGTTGTAAVVRYILADRDLWVMCGEDSWERIDDNLYLSVLSGLFHYFKLVFDPSTGKYVRLLINNSTYDLSAYNCWQYAETTYRHMTPDIRFYGRETYNDKLYLDDMTVTVAEP